MSIVSRHSLLLQTAYSEVKRRASEQAHVLIGSPGSLSERKVSGSRFYYRQFYDAQGKKAADYVGPVGKPEGEARATRRRLAQFLVVPRRWRARARGRS